MASQTELTRQIKLLRRSIQQRQDKYGDDNVARAWQARLARIERALRAKRTK